MAIQQAKRSFKVAGVFQAISLVLMYAIIMIVGSQDPEEFVVPLAWASVSAQVLSAISVIVGLIGDRIAVADLPARRRVRAVRRRG